MEIRNLEIKTSTSIWTRHTFRFRHYQTSITWSNVWSQSQASKTQFRSHRIHNKVKIRYLLTTVPTTRLPRSIRPTLSTMIEGVAITLPWSTKQACIEFYEKYEWTMPSTPPKLPHGWRRSTKRKGHLNGHGLGNRHRSRTLWSSKERSYSLKNHFNREERWKEEGSMGCSRMLRRSLLWRHQQPCTHGITQCLSKHVFSTRSTIKDTRSHRHINRFSTIAPISTFFQ